MVQNTTNKGIFGDDKRCERAINPYGMSRPEWWLNVNYAEIIELRDSVNLSSLRARLAK